LSVVDASRLQSEAHTLGVELDEVQAGSLIRYVALLERWNARFNLISRRDIGRIWPRHILDSLSIAPLLAREKAVVFDVGTGAGLPGLPLAIALPRLRWLLLDRNQRKIRFLETVIAELGLENVRARVEDLDGQVADDLDAAADVVVSRAVDTPSGLLTLAEPLLKVDGRLILMTATASTEAEPGASAAEGPERLGPGFIVSEVHELSIPGLDRTHEVTIIERR
jgi:16S rRNA (guanine527-N7)-methyltransferase